MKYVSVLALLIAGVTHLLPLQGVLGTGNLARLYGITVSDPNTAILLQHRALLFGILGALMLMAIPVSSLRIVALSLGFVSAASFIVVAVWVGNYNAEINRVVVADVIASLLLGLGLCAEVLLRSSQTA